MKPTLMILALLAAALPAQAASYVEQAAFLAVKAGIALDRDSIGNLYSLGLVPGTTASYRVSSYATPDLQPLLSFDAGVSTPVAFAVESNAVVDILDAANAFTFTRYNNTGEILGRANRLMPYLNMSSYYSSAVDRSGFLYIAYRYAVGHSVGDFGFAVEYYKGAVSQYDFQGRLQRTFFLPGRTDISTTCYTPSLMSVDTQGSLWVADPTCHHLLSYSSDGTLINDVPSAFPGAPRGLWTGPASSVFLAESVCDGFGCPHGAVLRFDDSGAQQNYLLTSSTGGAAWDSRILYLGSPDSSPLRRFILNNPPAAPVQSSPLGSVVQHSSAPFFTWQAPNDADGDALLYSVYLGTSPSQLSSIGSTTQTDFTGPALVFGATYYWRVVVSDSYLGLPLQTATAAVTVFNLNLANRPPAAFNAKTGNETAVTRESAVNLSWQLASDPDGDAVTYLLSWRPSWQYAPTVIVTTATSQVMTGLAFGTTYFWSVTARDGYGAATAMAGGATQAYLPIFDNTAPPAPVVPGGTVVVSLHVLSPQVQLSWSPVTDLEGDLVTYRLSLGTSPESLVPVADSTATAYALSPLYGTTYYWQVTAYDPFGAAGVSPVASLLTVLRNEPPSAFSLLTGTAPVSTRESSWPLSWQQAADADGDPVSYELALSTSHQSLPVVQTSSVTSYLLSFQAGATYYWQVVARDGFGGETSSGLQVFRVDFLNIPPSVPKLSAPFLATPTVKTMRESVRITWDKVSTPQGDAITYTAYLGDTPAELRAVAFVEQSSGSAVAALRTAALAGKPSAQIQDEGDTVTLDLTGLDYYHSYYFQVAAQNPYGAASRTPLQTFSLAAADSFPRGYNYPNPFSPNRGGTNVVFNAPTSGYARAVLTIYSEFGRKLYERDCGRVPPGISEIRFDGRDQSGRALMNGSYVGRVRFDGPSETATFFLLVVK